MLTVFWDLYGIISADFLPRGKGINAEYCCNLLKNRVREAICKKLLGKLLKNVILFYDNPRLHTVNLTTTAL